MTLIDNTTPDDPLILSGQFWGELRVFLAVAKARSFNKAAEALGTSHPTVARQVKRLQDLIGSQLFVSTKTGVRLTARGEELARSLTTLDQSLYALTNDLKAESRDAEGLVRLSIADGLNVAFVTPNLNRFSSEHPRVQVAMRDLTNINDLRENQTDIMIGFGTPVSAEMHCRPLGYLHFVPMAAREYVRTHGLPSRANLAKHRFVHSESFAGQSGLWDRWLNAVYLGQIAHFCDNQIAYTMLVKAGAGIGLLASYISLDPNIIPLDLDVHVALPIVAIVPIERLQFKPVSLLFDWLCEIFSTTNPWFARELKLGQMPSEHDLGFRLSFNL
jgi:DNA-binding transcriptional LysR family regulator